MQRVFCSAEIQHAGVPHYQNRETNKCTDRPDLNTLGNSRVGYLYVNLLGPSLWTFHYWGVRAGNLLEVGSGNCCWPIVLASGQVAGQLLRPGLAWTCPVLGNGDLGLILCQFEACQEVTKSSNINSTINWIRSLQLRCLHVFSLRVVI